MMKLSRLLIPAFLCTLLAAFSAWAGDPWKEKPYTAWSKKEVKKILTDSPWAVVISVPPTWTRVGGEGAEAGPGDIRIGRPDTRTDVERGDPTRDPAGWNQNARLTMRWASAKVMRAARLREAQLAGEQLEGSAEEFLAREPEDHLLILEWDPMVLFTRSKAEAIQEHTKLHIKSTGAEIRPRRVRIRNREGSEPPSIVFHFEKLDRATGQPIIPADETAVEFVWYLGPTVISAKFDPSKMVTREGRDW